MIHTSEGGCGKGPPAGSSESRGSNGEAGKLLYEDLLSYIEDPSNPNCLPKVPPKTYTDYGDSEKTVCVCGCMRFRKEVPLNLRQGRAADKSRRDQEKSGMWKVQSQLSWVLFSHQISQLLPPSRPDPMQFDH